MRRKNRFCLSSSQFGNGTAREKGNELSGYRDSEGCWVPSGAERPPRKSVFFRPSAGLLPVFLLAGLVGSLTPSRGAAEGDSELTLLQFRALVQSQPRSPKSPEIGRQRVEETFFRLLRAQGREAAARQSLDRVSGWSKAAAARLAVQSSPALDAEVLHFSEVRAAAQVAQGEAERRQAQQQANALLGRNPDSPLTALTSSAGPVSEAGKTESPSRASSPLPQQQNVPAPSETAAWAKLRDQFENVLLPQANELLSKMYQNYLFGGLPLSALLWQEQVVYQTELQYRLVLAQAERQLSVSE